MRFSPLNHNLYIADLSGATTNAHVYDGTSGSSLFALTDPTLDEPSDLAFDAKGNLYIVNPGFENVLKSVAGTQAFTEFVTAGSGGLVNPTALTFGPDGKLYVLDTTSNPEIYRYNADGSFDTAIIPSFGFFQPADLAFGPDGMLYVSGTDLFQNVGEVLRFTSDGTPNGALIDSGLSNPTFLTFSVPEPSTAMLFGLGIAIAMAVGLGRRRRAT